MNDNSITMYLAAVLYYYRNILLLNISSESFISNCLEIIM